MPFTNVQNQPPPIPVVDEATIKARVAAARAYAFSSGTNSNFQTPLPPPKTDAVNIPTVEKTSQNFAPNIQDEDYAVFVKILTDESFFHSFSYNLDDDREDFLLEPMEEEEEEEEELSLEHTIATLHPSDDESEGEPFTIETELGLLIEEDLENAVTTLLSQHQSTPNNLSDSPPRTPLRGCSRNSVPTVSQEQFLRLKRLMQRHYQLLVQQAVLSVRAISKKHPHHGGESSDDLADILDSAVEMLQDLDQNRKDAIRTSIQLKKAMSHSEDNASDIRLTRAAFLRTLKKANGEVTTFDVAGLAHLKSLFATIDKTKNIVEISDPKQACMQLLQISDYEQNILPGAVEYSDLLSQPKEVFGDEFNPPCSAQQIQELIKDRNQFTAGEDSLVFRGVNLYGEKQWLLIADRFLPDRSINIISQRYSKLSLLLFKANGVKIDNNGSLIKPPKLDSADKADKAALAALKCVEPPAILNVHRWSIEEDLTLLKAVPVLGHMWAELSTRLIPHRDRGHLRKRYQVLERRVKATVARAKKESPRLAKKETKPPPHFLKKRTTTSCKLSIEASTKSVSVPKVSAEKLCASGKTSAEVSAKKKPQYPPIENSSVSLKHSPTPTKKKHVLGSSVEKSNFQKHPPTLTKNSTVSESSVEKSNEFNVENASPEDLSLSNEQGLKSKSLHPHLKPQYQTFQSVQTPLSKNNPIPATKSIPAPKVSAENSSLHSQKSMQIPEDQSLNSGLSYQSSPLLLHTHLLPRYQDYQPIQVPSSDGHHQDSYSQDNFLIGHFEDTKEGISRYGVEHLLNNDNLNSNSHLARVEQMLKNDPSERSLGSEVLSNTNQLTEGTGKNCTVPKAAMDRLQKNLQIYHSEASNRSHGLDILAANAREGESPVKPMKTSILTSVFLRANRQEHHNRDVLSPSRNIGPSSKSPIQKIGFSPSASFLPMPSPNTGFFFGSNSHEDFGFEISDRSRQIFGTPSKLPSLESNSTMEDLNAASALNSLSNSPTRSRLLPCALKESGEVKRSLFDRAIKKPNQQNKKRKF